MTNSTMNIKEGNQGVAIGGSVIGDVTNIAKATIHNNIQPIPRILSSPPTFSVTKLIGRQSTEDRLYEALNASGNTPVRLLLRGMGGIGKTSLAKALFNRCFNTDYFKHLIWLNGTDEQGLLFIAQNLNIDTKQAGWEDNLSNALANLPHPCLGIIDNLTLDKHEKFASLSNCPNWSVLVTSRHKLSQFTEEILVHLHEDDCIALYQHHCGFEDDSEAVRQLVQKAGHHTLAIELLGKTAAASEKTAAVLLTDLIANGFDLSIICKETVGARYGQQDKDIEERLYEHFKILFDLADLDDQQKTNLKQIAMLGISAHKAQHLEQWLTLASKTPLHCLVKTGWLQSSKIEENQQCYTLHPIIADIVLREIELAKDITNRLTDNVKKSLHVGDTGHGTEHQEKFAGAQYLIDYLNNQPDLSSSELLAHLASHLARCFFDCGFLQQAQPLYECALGISEKNLGSCHLDVARCLGNLAGLYGAQGKYEEAQPLYERDLNICEKILKPDHPDVARCLNNLATFYYSHGRYNEALLLYERILGICEKAFRPDHPKMLIILNNLALIYKAQSRFDEALPLHERVLDICEKNLDPNHPNVALSLNNLALLYKAQGRYDEALPLHERVLDICEKNLGPNHPDMATSLDNLAELYKVQGRYDEAQSLYERALGIREKVFGPDHPNTVRMKKNIKQLQER